VFRVSIRREDFAGWRRCRISTYRIYYPQTVQFAYQGADWMRQALLERPATAWVNRTLAISYARLGQRPAALDSIDAFRRIGLMPPLAKSWRPFHSSRIFLTAWLRD
jgi:hypothetical protein